MVETGAKVLMLVMSFHGSEKRLHSQFGGRKLAENVRNVNQSADTAQVLIANVHTTEVVA